MRKLLILIAALVSFAAFAGTVKLEYGEFDDDLRQLAEFEELRMLKIFLMADSVESKYDLVAVTVTPDSVSEQLISIVMPVTLNRDTIEWNVFAKPLSEESVKIRISGTGCPTRIHDMPTAMSILFECMAQTEFDEKEEIPLFAYSPGAEFEMNWNGETVKGYQYCQVRDCGKHPSEWGKTFNLPSYVYYVLRPKH